MNIDRRAFLQAAGAFTVAAATQRAVAQETKKYKACVIGDSKDGGYGHDLHRVFGLRDDVAVVGLADPDEAGRAKYAAECGAERSYADYTEMLAKERPDLVAVGPRTTVRHKEYLLACVEAGAHGFMEKPLCVDLEEADAMVAAIDAKNLKWSLAYNFRALPMMPHIKKLVFDDGLIGSVLEIRGRGKEDNRAGSEDLIVLGTHILDLMAYFLGDAQWCMADITHNGQSARPEHVREASEALGPVVGNRLHAMYGFEKGVAGHFSSMKSRDGNGGRWGLEIHGTKGVIDMAMDVIPHVRWLDDSTWSGSKRGTAWQPIPDMPDLSMADDPNERYSLLINDLISGIEEDRAPMANFNEARRAQEMIQAVFASYVQGTRVALPLSDRTHPLKGWA